MPDVHDRLGTYADLVRFWARRLDLVSPGDLDRFEARHIDDSLRLAPLLETLPGGAAVDVGSGAGLPGIPLAIVAPAFRWRLIEPRNLRAAFLDEAVRALELNCEVLRMTAEEAIRARHLVGAHVVATARAVAPPERSFELLRPLVVPGGVAVTFVGEGAEIPARAEEWRPGIAMMRVMATGEEVNG
jgi:16S rRNA (guanine527-N7)-methyltransferase